MFGLEAGECNPFPGTGRRAAKRTGQLLDATSRVAASYALIAPGCHWSVPALEGIPTEYRFLGGLDAAARLGKTLLVSGVAATDAWCQAGRDPFRFIEQTLKDWIEAHGGQEIDSDLFLRLGLVSDLDPYGQDGGEQNAGTRCI